MTAQISGLGFLLWTGSQRGTGGTPTACHVKAAGIYQVQLGGKLTQIVLPEVGCGGGGGWGGELAPFILVGIGGN